MSDCRIAESTGEGSATAGHVGTLEAESALRWTCQNLHGPICAPRRLPRRPPRRGSTRVPGTTVAIIVATLIGIGVVVSVIDKDSDDGSGGEAGSEGHTLNGTIILSGDWDSIEVSSPSGNVTTIGGSRYQQVVGEWCQGGGGYGDVTEGAQVLVKDTGNTTVAFGTLEAGSLTGVPEQPLSENGWECTLPFTVRNVPTLDTYSVETGSRGGLLYTYDEMVSSGWRIGLTLGP